MRERRLSAEEGQEILRKVRPEIPPMIARYEIPEEPVADIILASMDCLLRLGHGRPDPGQFFLQTLEGYCESWVAAEELRKAEEAARSAEETAG